MRSIFTAILLGGLLSTLSAQVVAEWQQTFDWAPTPTVYLLGSDKLERWSFSEAIFDDGHPELPHWVKEFPIAGPGAVRVSVVEVEFEDFSQPPSLDDPLIDSQLRFTTTVSRQPEGWIARVSSVPIIKTETGYRRVRRWTLLIERRAEQAIATRGPEHTETSVLSRGDNFKLAVTQAGVYRLSYDFLKNKLGISNLDQIDPRTIKLYGNGGGYLPYFIHAPRIDDLTENHIFVSGQDDGRFDSGDYILFYAQGPDVWRYNDANGRFDYQRNIYDTKNYYFIQLSGGNGLRIGDRADLGNAAYTTTSYDGRYRFEEDKVNIMKELDNRIGSSQRWYGDYFYIAREKNYKDVFALPGLVPGEQVRVRAEAALRANRPSTFDLVIDGRTLTSGRANSVPVGDHNLEIYNEVAMIAVLNDSLALTNEAVSITFRYPTPAGASSSEGWLDYLQLQARQALRMHTDQVDFRDLRSLDFPTAGFRLADAADTEVWDITDPLRPRRQQTSATGNELQFGVTVDTLREFIAFRRTRGFPEPTAVGRIPTQNVHGIRQADMIIVYHPDFAAPAARLAEHRAEVSDLNVALVNVQEIYNEFSSGSVDPTAIRDFMQMVHDRDPALQYLLLFGDGSFDNRDIYQLGGNFLPIYERDRHHEIYGYPSDDYYGIFDGTAQGDPLAYDLNVSIGRLPVQSMEEAEAMVNKLIRYDVAAASFGDWRVRMLFLGDDEDSGIHSRDVDVAAQLVEDSLALINKNKLYFDLYPQLSTPAGDRFPDVSASIDRDVFRGVLAMTYLGHGGPRGWAQERVLDIPMLQNWRNQDQLPLCITATCTFGGYDDGTFVSAGEEMLLNARGGAIALFTTTRPVIAHQNAALTRATLQQLLTRDGPHWPRLGDVIRRAKNSQTSPNSFDNTRKFTLLGDPATRIALPNYGVRTLSINGKALDTLRFDTLRALQKVTVEGEIVDLQGNPLSDFNGLVYPTVYDKKQQVKTLQQDPGSSAQTFQVQKNVLFKGRATVTNGRFSFTFVVPKDIDYSFGPGKISYYAADTDRRIDAAGYYDRAIIGGTDPNALADQQGPQVEVFLNSEEFTFGGNVQPNATLLVKLADDNGINVAGNSIGHDLEAVLDNDTRNTLLLNDFYEAAPDDYSRGTVRYPLRDLAPGRHTIKVRAWDVANNSAEGSTEFIVASDGRIALSHVLNYPNPFTDNTCFQFDHNLVGEDLEVLVQIFTVSGRLVKTLTALIPASSGSIRRDDCIAWDGRDEYGDVLARGVYLYQVRVRGAGGTETSGTSKLEKLVILK